MRPLLPTVPTAMLAAGPPAVMRTTAMMSAAFTPAGGTTKSCELRPVPPVVVALMRPDETFAGTVNESAVVEEMVDEAVTPFNCTVVADVLKLVPETLIDAPETPDVGVKLVIVGAPGTVTTKSVALVTVLPPTVTVMRPVVAPLGTVVLIEPASDAVTVAVVLLNLTVLFAGVALKPKP